jgi:hypothetical protein
MRLKHPGSDPTGGGAVPSPGRVRPPGEAGWFGQGGGAATMAAKEQRALADRLVRQTDTERPSRPGAVHGSAAIQP